MGFLLQIRMSWARAFEGVSVLALVLWSWVLVAERAFAAAAAGVVSWQSAPALVSAGCARCGSAVSWLRVQAVYILVPASRMSTDRGTLPLSGSMLAYVFKVCFSCFVAGAVLCGPCNAHFVAGAGLCGC